MQSASSIVHESFRMVRRTNETTKLSRIDTIDAIVVVAPPPGRPLIERADKEDSSYLAEASETKEVLVRLRLPRPRPPVHSPDCVKLATCHGILSHNPVFVRLYVRWPLTPGRIPLLHECCLNVDIASSSSSAVLEYAWKEVGRSPYHSLITSLSVHSRSKSSFP